MTKAEPCSCSISDSIWAGQWSEWHQKKSRETTGATSHYHAEMYSWWHNQYIKLRDD